MIVASTKLMPLREILNERKMNKWHNRKNYAEYYLEAN